MIILWRLQYKLLVNFMGISSSKRDKSQIKIKSWFNMLRGYLLNGLYRMHGASLSDVFYGF